MRREYKRMTNDMGRTDITELEDKLKSEISHDMLHTWRCRPEDYAPIKAKLDKLSSMTGLRYVAWTCRWGIHERANLWGTLLRETGGGYRVDCYNASSKIWDNKFFIHPTLSENNTVWYVTEKEDTNGTE